MLRFLSILILTSALSAAELRYAIQVLSVKDKGSISDAFMAKVKGSSMPFTQKHAKGRYKVFLGEFKSYESAALSLDFVRKKVEKSAFITRMEDRYTLDPKQKMQQAMLLAQARTLKKINTEDTYISEKELATVEPIKVSGPQEKVVIERKETKKVLAMQKDVKSEEIYCKPSKRALRESEISDALAFYRQSLYYTFTQ